MGTLTFVVSLLMLVSSAWGGCRQADWQAVLDRRNVWANCNANEYMRGLRRSDNVGGRDERLGRIEYANCCTCPESYGDVDGDCVNADWKTVLNRNNRWALCPQGRYMQGMYKSKGKWLNNIEEGKCCKPQGHPDNWGECYDEDVSSSFDKKGWSTCKDGYYMVGFYRGRCKRISCIQTFRCCKMQEKEPEGCKEGEKVLNDCGDECVCDARGEATDCVRIRKEFTTMTKEEQRRYVSTAKRIATDPRLKPAYDDLIYTHRILFPSIIHTRDMFLPWHRYFLLQYENLLRQADCRVSAIYWDWSLVADDPFRDEPGDVWYAGDHGLGGNGKCQEGEDGPCCVGDGVFAESEFSLVPGSVTECLRRKFWKDPVQNSTTVQALLQETDFEKFEATWRQFHNWIHVAIGGTMATDDSASAPEFFFHHGFVDKFWGDWQSVSDANKNAYFWKVNHLMPRQGIWPWQLVDLMNQPGSMGPIKVKYASPRGRGGKNLAVEEEEPGSFFHMSPGDAALAKAEENKIQG